MLFSPVVLCLYEPSGAEIQLKIPITSIVASKKVIFPSWRCPNARVLRDEGLFIPSTQVEEEMTDYFHLYWFPTHSALSDRAIKNYNLGSQVCKIQNNLFLIVENVHVWGAAVNELPTHHVSLDAGKGTELLLTWSILCLFRSCCSPGSTKHLISLISVLALLHTSSFHPIHICCRWYKSRNSESQHILKIWLWQLLEKTLWQKIVIGALLKQKYLW